MKNLSYCLMVVGCILSNASHGQVTPMIVNGNNTTIDQQPWQVIVSRGGDNGCGGTIIGPTSILTAAHCVHQHSAGQIQVYAGVTFLDQRNNGQVRSVSQVILHPTWNAGTYVGGRY